VPLASYTVVHTEVATRPLMWFLVAGGLLYSSISVYTWAVQIFRWRLRALGFVVLIECLVFAAWLQPCRKYDQKLRSKFPCSPAGWRILQEAL
jgi:hypothetical protein